MPAAGRRLRRPRPIAEHPQEPSWTDKIGTSFKSGTDKIASMVAPKPKPGEESTLQAQQEARARRLRGHGRDARANGPTSKRPRRNSARRWRWIPTIWAPCWLMPIWKIGSETSKRRQVLSASALKKHPRTPPSTTTWDCVITATAKLSEAAKTLEKAVELEPHKKLYRDNLAAVLVDQGKTNEALAQLVEAHGEAVGNYNLAYLLVQKARQPGGACTTSAPPLQLDPSLRRGAAMDRAAWRRPIRQFRRRRCHRRPWSPVASRRQAMPRVPSPPTCPTAAYAGAQPSSGYAERRADNRRARAQ